MTDETEADTEEQKTKHHDGRSNVSAGNVPTIEEFPNSTEETLNDKQSIISQRK